MTYPYPPVPQPPAPEPRRSWFARHKILTGVGVLLLVFVVIGIATGGGSKPAADAPAAPTHSAPAQATTEPTQTTAPKETAAATPSKAPAAAEYSDGDYVVGEDIPAGTYTSAGASPGAFELCMITTQGDGGNNWGQLKSANADERIIITLNASDHVLTVSGCEPLKRR